VTEEPAASPSRRSWFTPGRLAGAGALILVLVFVAAWIAPADGYELQLVDPAHPVAPLVRIAGHPTKSDGTIYFVDVRERPARLIERLVPWVRADGSSLVHSPPISSALEQRLGAVEMSDSQKIAPYVALKLLGYKTTAQSGGVTVLALEPKAYRGRGVGEQLLRGMERDVVDDGGYRPAVHVDRRHRRCSGCGRCSATSTPETSSLSASAAEPRSTRQGSRPLPTQAAQGER